MYIYIYISHCFPISATVRARDVGSCGVSSVSFWPRAARWVCSNLRNYFHRSDPGDCAHNCLNISTMTVSFIFHLRYYTYLCLPTFKLPGKAHEHTQAESLLSGTAAAKQ